MQLYVSFWINSNIPIPIYLIASNLIQPKLPVALLYINDSGGLKKIKIKPKRPARWAGQDLGRRGQGPVVPDGGHGRHVPGSHGWTS